MKNEKKLYQKWWFLIILLVIIIIIGAVIYTKLENEKLETTFKNMGEGFSDYYDNKKNITSHLNEFTYNYETNESEYKPKIITLEIYNRIKEGMTQEEVILNLGKYDNKLNGENTYMLEWGNSNMSKGYWISIIFNKEGTVVSKSQIGLK